MGYNVRMHNRLGWVDALRGIAVLLVLGRHLPIQFAPTVHLGLIPLKIWKHIGWTGVDLFFVISGFLVSGLLFREYQRAGKIDIWRFFIRRAIRILIPFYAFLVLSSPMRLPYLHLSNICVELFFLQGYFHAWVMWNHTWTLAIEEHFYLFLGLLMFVLSRQKSKRGAFQLIPLVWGLLAAGCLLTRIGNPHDSPYMLFQSHLRFDTLFFGVLIAFFYDIHQGAFIKFVRRFRYAIIAASVMAILPVFFLEAGQEPFITRFGLTGVYLAFGGALAVCLLFSATPPKWLMAIGRISYSVYLWHIPVRILTLSIYPGRSFSVLEAWSFCGFYITLALVVGSLFYRVIEKPSLAWRDRQFA